MKRCLLLLFLMIFSVQTHAQNMDSAHACPAGRPISGQWNLLSLWDFKAEADIHLIVFTARRTIVITFAGREKYQTITAWFPQDAYAYLFNFEYTTQGNAPGKYMLWPVFDSAGRIPSAYYLGAAKIASDPARYFEFEPVQPLNYLPILSEGIKTYPWLMDDEEFKLIYHSLMQREILQ